MFVLHQYEAGLEVRDVCYVIMNDWKLNFAPSKCGKRLEKIVFPPPLFTIDSIAGEAAKPKIFKQDTFEQKLRYFFFFFFFSVYTCLSHS